MQTSDPFDLLTRLRPDPAADPDQTAIGLARLQREVSAEPPPTRPGRRRRVRRIRRLVLVAAICLTVAMPVLIFPGSPTASADLTPLAERAERQKTLQPGPGEYYYRRTRPGADDSYQHERSGEVGREEWISPPGGPQTILTRHNGGYTNLWRGPLTERMPWMSLSTNPILLEAQLRLSASGSLNQDEAVWSAMYSALTTNPDPQHRAALIKVLPRLTHVTVRKGTDDLGRPATIISRTEPMRGPDNRVTLYLDPVTGRTLQERSENGGTENAPDTPWVWSSILVEERLTEGPPTWVPLPGLRCAAVKSNVESFQCR